MILFELSCCFVWYISVPVLSAAFHIFKSALQQLTVTICGLAKVCRLFSNVLYILKSVMGGKFTIKGCKACVTIVYDDSSLWPLDKWDQISFF
jgi:hypothetical protein